MFGASDIVGDLQIAIDRAFDKIIAVENNHDSELQMVDNTTQWTIYDPDATDYMVKLMTPQRNGTYKPDMAFGAFLGYTIKRDQSETDSQKYRVAGYSFYFYLLPFNDAANERISIIQELLSGGGI